MFVQISRVYVYGHIITVHGHNNNDGLVQERRNFIDIYIYMYIYIYIYQMDCVCQRYHKECSTRTCADECYNC